MTAIRVLAPQDAPAVAALHALAGADEWSQAACETLLRDPVIFGFAAERGGDMSGSVLARAAGGEAEILMIAVAPDARRRGIATALTRAALAAALARGAATMHLEVSEENIGAIALYRDLGFIDAGRRIGYYVTPHGRVDARIMSCRLAEEP